MKHSNRYWCSGKLYCGLCGFHYVSRTKRLKNGMQYKAWRCYAAVTYGRPKERMGEIVGCSNSSINEKALRACMRYLITHIKVNYETSWSEIIHDIKALQSSSIQETGRISGQIESLKEKKKKLIDLMLDGTLSKEDLKEQMAWYDEQIQELDLSLEKSVRDNKIMDRQAMEQETYIAALDDILSFDENNQDLYREILEKMVITDNVVEVYLKGVPFAARLTVRSSGKKRTM